MAVKNLLYKRDYIINDLIKIHIPTVGEILDAEDYYYNLLSIFVAMPIDLMVLLDNNGIDFTTIDEYQLFLLLFDSVKEQDTSKILCDLNLSTLKKDINPENSSVVLVNESGRVVIDRAIHGQIADALRAIHQIKKNTKKPANKEAKDFMLKRAKAKLRRKKKVEDSELEKLIIAMVNSEPYKYDFEGTRELSIYQFNESVRQVVKKVDYNNKMYGVYTGSINVKDLSQNDLNWLTHD